jgi:modification methylase
VRIEMSNCKCCDGFLNVSGENFCTIHNKPLSKCAGGCSKNRKSNLPTVEELRQIEDNKKLQLIPFINKIVCGDCLELMKQLPSDSIDVVVTSPPYNLRNSTGNAWKYFKNKERIEKNATFKTSMLNECGYDVHSDDMPYDEYVTWQRNCLSEMIRIIKPNGFIFYNHKSRVQGGLLQSRMEILDGFPLRQIITWWRGKTANDINDSYFFNNVEQIFFIAKQKKSYLKKGANKFGLVWQIHPAYNKKKYKHPAPFPIEIPDRCLDSLNLTEESIVLDPFVGCGTTAMSAIKHNIKYIGFDLSPEYCKIAEENIKDFLISIAPQDITNSSLV